jgi:hypothetical protein
VATLANAAFCATDARGAASEVLDFLAVPARGTLSVYFEYNNPEPEAPPIP